MEEQKERFEFVYWQRFHGDSHDRVEILVDRETGVNYLYREHVNAGGLAPLLDRDGKPVVTPLPK